MSNIANQVLDLLLSQYQHTGKIEVSIVLPAELKQFRKEAAEELKGLGLISQIVYYGKDKLYCALSVSALKSKDMEE